MKSSQIISYWNTRNLTTANNSIVERTIRKHSGTDVNMYECSIEKVRKQLNRCEHQRLREFIGLYALMLLLQKINHQEEEVVRVRVKGGIFYPLAESISLSEPIKKSITQLYDAYRELYGVAQLTRGEVIRFIQDGEVIQESNGIHYVYAEENLQDVRAEVKDKQDSADKKEMVILAKDKLYLQAAVHEEYLTNFADMYQQAIISVISCLFEKETGPAKRNVTGNEVSILSEKTENIIQDFSRGEVREQTPFDVYDRWKDRVCRTPDRVALTCGKNSLSYRELDAEITEYRNKLKEAGISEGDRLLLLTRNDMSCIVKLFAIWAMRAVYIPTSGSYAKAKIMDIARQTGAKAILGDEIFILDSNAKENREEDMDAMNSNREISHIILTSGTTGEPKMVAIEKSGFGNLCDWYTDEFQFNEDSSSLLLTNFLFDASVKNLVVPLITGGRLVVLDTELYDIAEIVNVIEREKITHVNTVPSLMDKILELSEASQLKSLKWIVLGGEGFRIDRKKLRESKCKAANVYGPTEATDLAAFHILKQLEETPVPIGAPIANKLVYIMDENRNLLPPYVRGDIYIAGAGVIEGYLNVSPKNVFFDNPFEPSRPLYRTGDVGMWNTEGEIIYLGRKDNQIKVNGQRIELEEIDAIAGKCPGVRMAAAVIAEGRIILCYTSEKNCTVDKEMLHKVYERYMSKSLHPGEYISMEDMPLTGNGKVDRKALVQRLQDKKEHAPVVLPQNKTEELVLEAWKETLGVPEISTESPFFEAGGNSLLLNRLKLELDKRINNSLSITDFFEYGTIKLIAQQIERKE